MLNIRGYRAEVLLPSSGCSWPPQARMPVLSMGSANRRQAIYSTLLSSRLQLFSHAHLTKNSCRGKGHCCNPTSLSNALKLFSQPAPIQQTRVVRNVPARPRYEAQRQLSQKLRISKTTWRKMAAAESKAASARFLCGLTATARQLSLDAAPC